MTEERRAELEEKLNMAEASGDPAQVSAIKKTMEQEYRLCTSHTASRLKRVETTVNAIKDGLIPANMFSEMKEGMENLNSSVGEMKAELESWKQKVKGAKMLWNLLGYIAAAGGSGYIVKLLLGTAKTGGVPGITQ